MGVGRGRSLTSLGHMKVATRVAASGRVRRELEVPVPVDRVEQVRLLEVRQQPGQPRPGLRRAVARQDHDRREGVVRGQVVVQGQADLLQVVRALGPPGGLAGRLDGGQEQADQDAR